MKCNEIRNLVLPYLDSELDAKTSQDIQLHLQSCSECAQILEKESKFNERLFLALRAGQPTEALWDKIESRLQPRSRVWSLLRHWKMAALAAVAALAVVLFIGGRFNAHTLELAKVIEQDHREFIEGKIKPEFSGTVPESIATELQGRLDADAFNKVPAAPRFRSDGARLCHLDGVPVAWTLGHCGHVPVSVIVFKKSELEHFPKTRRRLETGEPIVCTRTGRFQFAVRLAGEHVVCAIADASKQMLEDLLKSIPDAG